VLLPLGHRGMRSLEADAKYGTTTMPSSSLATGGGDEEDASATLAMRAGAGGRQLQQRSLASPLAAMDGSRPAGGCRVGVGFCFLERWGWSAAQTWERSPDGTDARC
jgi:hypothetical protein